MRSATLDNAGLAPRIRVAGVSHPEDVYTWLLRTLVATAQSSDDEAASKAALQHGLMLIGRKWDRMDVAAALDCLPGSTKLSELDRCLSAMSIGMLRQSHSCSLQVRFTIGHH